MIYVDDLFATAPTKKWPYCSACHLTADSVEELLHFAVAVLGMKKGWYQPHPTNLALCHFDLTPAMRRSAIEKGAYEITGKAYSDRVFAKTGPNTQLIPGQGSVIPFGYADGGSLTLERLMALNGAFLVDIRLSPYGWGIFKKEELETHYPQRYVHMPELGNTHYKQPELGIKIVNPTRGIPRLIKGIQQGRTLILMCGCKHYHSCHRKVVIEALLREMPDAMIVMPSVAAPVDTIKCLSIMQPWGYLIARGYKNIENRSYPPGGYSGPLLIHVGAKFDEDCFTSTGNPLEKFLAYVDYACGLSYLPARGDYPTKALIGIGTLAGVVEESESRWFQGPYGWTITDARPFDKPVRYSGQPGLFDVPRDVVADYVKDV